MLLSSRLLSWCVGGLALSLVIGCGDIDSGSGSTGSTGAPGSEDTDDGNTSPAATTTAEPGTTAEPTTADPPATDTGNDTTSGTTAAGAPTVVMDTTMGTIVIELYEDDAPITVANFLAYTEAGFYDGVDGLGATVVHRVIPGFVIQGGGLTEALGNKATMPAIVNESSNGLNNLRGTLSMARTNDPDSATSQFFVNLVDNANLDTPPGYAVFGEVVQGMEVVDAIAAVPTATMGPYEDVPVDPVIILSATVQ